MRRRGRRRTASFVAREGGRLGGGAEVGGIEVVQDLFEQLWYETGENHRG